MQVSIREFKSHLSSYVEQAQSGATIELTSHRKVVARIVGVPVADNTGLARLLAAGAVWSGGKPAGAELHLQATGKPVSAMVTEDR